MRRSAIRWGAILCGGLLLLGSPSARAETFATPIEGHVTDPAHRLGKADRAELEAKIGRIQSEIRVDLPIFLVADLGGLRLEEVAERAFAEWKIGKQWEAGALLVVTPDDRAVIQLASGGWRPWRPEETPAILKSSFAPVLRKEGLQAALEKTVEALAEKAEAPRVRPAGAPARRYRSLFFVGTALTLLLVAWMTLLRARGGPAGSPGPSPIPGSAPTTPDPAAGPITEWLKRPSWTGRPQWIDLLALTLVGAVLRTWWLSRPHGALVFDENYYVQDARVILGWAVSPHHLPADALSGLDPNSEHPPLAKLLIALSMRLLGDNAWGWRLPSLICGIASIPILYGIVRRLRGTHVVALYAAFFWAFDNLSIVHSRIAVLDIFVVFFLLCGVYAYLRGFAELAGALLAVATACKITGVFGLCIIGLFELLQNGREALKEEKARRRLFADLTGLGAAYAVTTLCFLGLLDSTWTKFASPVEHIGHILRYGVALSRDFGPQGIESKPWQWMLNEVQIPYIAVDEVVRDLKRPIIHFRGAMNPYIIFVAPLALACCAQRALRRREALPTLALAFLLAAYLPFFVFWLGSSRISYLFYFLPALPAIAIANAVLARTLRPSLVRHAYVIAVIAGTWAYFPFRKLFY